MAEAQIHVRPNGSLKVYGRVRLFDAATGLAKSLRRVNLTVENPK